MIYNSESLGYNPLNHLNTSHYSAALTQRITTEKQDKTTQMPQDSAKINDLPEHSPVSQARAKLAQALEQLESIVLARMDEAAAVSAAPAATKDSDAVAKLQAQVTELRAENRTLSARNTALEKAQAETLKALDDAIAQVEAVLKG